MSMVLMNLFGAISCFTMSFILFALTTYCDSKKHENISKIFRMPAYLLGKCSEIFIILTFVHFIYSLLGV